MLGAASTTFFSLLVDVPGPEAPEDAAGHGPDLPLVHPVQHVAAASFKLPLKKKHISYAYALLMSSLRLVRVPRAREVVQARLVHTKKKLSPHL